MESENIFNNDKYYEKESYNVFDNYSVHGLNIDGIKKYYSIPVNQKYHHMVKLNKDLDEIIKKHLKEKEKREKEMQIKRYNDEKLIEMYSGKTEENNNKTILKNPFQQKQFLEKKNNIKLLNDNITVNNQINTLGTNNSEINPKTPNINPVLTNNLFYKSPGTTKNIYLPKNKNNKNISYSLIKYRRKIEKNKKIDLPMIKPRRIIIEYQLTNDAGITEENKNLGHNEFMGSSFNPLNYYVRSKNRTKRNVYGGLFVH